MEPNGRWRFPPVRRRPTRVSFVLLPLFFVSPVALVSEIRSDTISYTTFDNPRTQWGDKVTVHRHCS